MANKLSICPECKNQFAFGPGRGQARKYCGANCANAAKTRKQKDGRPHCKVDGCSRLARSRTSPHCEAHYYRIRRNGTILTKSEVAPPPDLVRHTEGYLLQYVPGHPLQRARGSRVYQHRVVYFEAHGVGPFKCHWCGTSITWDTMDIAHLNAIRDDNRLSNLVASCHPCNVRRGNEKMTSTHRARSSAKLTWNGETLTLGEWAARIGISRPSLVWRIQNGWAIERALTEPRGVTGPR